MIFLEKTDELPVDLSSYTPDEFALMLLIDIIIFGLIVFISILALRKHRIRKKPINSVFLFMTTMVSISILFLIANKSLILYFTVDYAVAFSVRKISWWFILANSIALLAVDLELFTKTETKTRILLIMLYWAVCFIPLIGEMTRLDEANYLPMNILLLSLLSAFPSIIHVFYAGNMLRKPVEPVFKVGMFFIFLMGVLQVFIFVIILSYNALGETTLLYLVKNLFLFSAIFVGYMGFFMPEWVKNWVENREQEKKEKKKAKLIKDIEKNHS